MIRIYWPIGLLIACIVSLMPITAEGADSTDIALLSKNYCKAGQASGTERWSRFFNAGISALNERMYELSVVRLLAAENEAKKAGSAEDCLISSNIALSTVFAAMEDYGQAEKLISLSMPRARKLMGSRSLPVAQVLHVLAQIKYVGGGYSQAESFCNESLAIREEILGPEDPDVGQSVRLLAKIKDSQGWVKEAEPLFARALAIMKKHPGFKQLDQADVLQDFGLYLKSQGKTLEGKALLERSQAILESVTQFDEPSLLRGSVIFRWNAGLPGAREIPDDRYPVRYLSANSLRVATALVHVGRTSGGKFYGALISITNTTRDRVEVGLGQVSLCATKPKYKQIIQLEPNAIDRVYWERAVWDLTRREPVLVNIQRARPNIGQLHGALPDLADNYGGNVFGTYGKWGITPISLPDLALRERMHARGEAVIEAGPAIESDMGLMNLEPVRIGPNESRTGIVFFHNDLFSQAWLKVVVGNATFEFPFKAVEPW